MRYPSLGLTMSMVESLLSNDALCKEFPFLAFVKKTWNVTSSQPGGGCGGCGSRPNREYRQHLLETVKASLVSMPPDRISRFKDLLNTDKLVLHFAVRGQTVTKEL